MNPLLKKVRTHICCLGTFDFLQLLTKATPVLSGVSYFPLSSSLLLTLLPKPMFRNP